MPITLINFSPLTNEKLGQIVADIPDQVIGLIAKKTAEAGLKYQDLIEGYGRAEDKKIFFEQNIQEVAYFLNECRLIGVPNEKKEVADTNFTIGAEGLAIISAYMQNKEKHAGVEHHQVQVIKNEDLKTAAGLRKISKIAQEKRHVHTALYKQLCKDFENVDELEKTYVIETFGTTGGNHIVTLTVKKEAGNDAPIIHLFDPSPALARNGLEAQQNSIAGGWCAQIAINATLKRALSDIHLQFDNNRYYNNSEPLQRGGPSICGTFALEEAHNISRHGLNQDYLQNYVYDGAFGGQTEIPVRELLNEHGYLRENPPLGLSAKTAYISHFTDTALSPREQELRDNFHRKKNGADETIYERVERYQVQEGETRGANQIAEQKSLRQKYAHLFEIVTGAAFEEKANHVPELEFTEFVGSPYFAGDTEVEINAPIGTKELIVAFNRILPRSNKVSDVEFNGAEAKITVYIGDETARKVGRNEDRNSFGHKIREIATVNCKPDDYSDQLTGVDLAFSHSTNLTVTVSQSNFAKFIEIANQQPNLYRARDDYPFAPPKATTPIGGAQVQGNHNQQLIV